MTNPDPMSCQTVIARKAEHDFDRAGAICELVTAATFGLKVDQEPTGRPLSTPRPDRVETRGRWQP